MIACALSAEQVADRLATLRRRIEAAGGDPDAVIIVAVTKGFDASAPAVAVDAGLTDLGESYAQEAVVKAEDGPAGVRWHWVGRLQRNKVRQVAPFVDLWHSIDRPELGAEVARRSPGSAVLVQVNTSGEDGQGGCAPADAPGLVADLQAEGLVVRGLMTIASRGPEAARACFRALREQADALALPERSMGMSDDLDAAVAEGATIVRVGTALFGSRTGAVPSSGESDRT